VSSVFDDAADELSRQALVHGACLVAYSGGKESRAVLDLCVRTFRRVVPFFLSFIPDLSVVEESLVFARERWSLDVRHYPHWLLAKCLKEGIYCDGGAYRDLPDVKLLDCYQAVRKDTGLPLIVTGARAADSLWRRYNLTRTASWPDVVHPLRRWQKADTLAYLQVQGIPVPDAPEGQATGIDLSTPSLLWLYDRYPDDFARLLEVFPYAGAAVKRRDWYGGDS
jgi:3'-phosphoadenosine 5'-phosphosulfate sulfotransferase (PAPS reductase)/FAD synthetase